MQQTNIMSYNSEAKDDAMIRKNPNVFEAPVWASFESQRLVVYTYAAPYAYNFV